MMLDRRSFMFVSGSLVVASSALAAFPPLFAHSSSGGVTGIAPSPRLIFRIEGWDSAGGLVDPISDQMLIRVNQRWRSAWR